MWSAFGFGRSGWLLGLASLAAACTHPATATPEARAQVGTASDSLVAATNCEPRRGFDRYGLTLFVATESELRALADCQYLGLGLDHRPPGSPKLQAGECRLREHSSYRLDLPRSSDVTLDHLGLVLDTPVISPAPPGEEAGDWPPSRLFLRGGTDSPEGGLREFPPAYVARLAALSDAERTQRAAELVQRLTRFWPELWASPQGSVQACSGYLRTLAEAARQAQVRSARLFVFQLLSHQPAP